MGHVGNSYTATQEYVVSTFEVRCAVCVCGLCICIFMRVDVCTAKSFNTHESVFFSSPTASKFNTLCSLTLLID